MKRLVATLVILICITSLSLAEQKTQQKSEQQPDMMSQGMMRGMKKDMGGHMMGGSTMYSMMVHHILMKASVLDLTDVQKKELGEINEKYLYTIVRKEADFKISHMKIMDMMHDPNFDPAKLKSEIKTSNQLSLEMSDMMVDALAGIRKTIGTENFTKLMKTMHMDCGMMMEDQPAQENTPSEHEGHLQDQ